MEDILRYGPKKIALNETVGDTVVRKERFVMRLTEGGLNSIMKHGQTGMVIISSQKSQIDDSDPENSLRPEFNEYAKTLGPIDSDQLYDIEKEWLRKRNAEKDGELRQDIRTAGYSYTPVYGGYHGKNSIKDEYEPSYIVYNYKQGDDNPGDFFELEAFAVDMCRKYKQESVYVQVPGDSPKYLDRNGNQVNMFSSDKFKFNDDDQEFYTTAKREKNSPQKFTADIVFENLYIPLRPASYNEKLRRTKQGEYIL